QSIAGSTIAPASPRPPARSSALWSPVLPTSADQHYPCISREPRKLGARPISSCIRLSPVYESPPAGGTLCARDKLQGRNESLLRPSSQGRQERFVGGGRPGFLAGPRCCKPTPDIDSSPPTVV